MLKTLLLFLLALIIMTSFAYADTSQPLTQDEMLMIKGGCAGGRSGMLCNNFYSWCIKDEMPYYCITCTETGDWSDSCLEYSGNCCFSTFEKSLCWEGH